MIAEIDWETLARRLGCLDAQGEHGSSDSARQALELIVGEEGTASRRRSLCRAQARIRIGAFRSLAVASVECDEPLL